MPFELFSLPEITIYCDKYYIHGLFFYNDSKSLLEHKHCKIHPHIHDNDDDASSE